LTVYSVLLGNDATYSRG